jgi:hypothetical protein
MIFLNMFDADKNSHHKSHMLMIVRIAEIVIRFP